MHNSGYTGSPLFQSRLAASGIHGPVPGGRVVNQSRHTTIKVAHIGASAHASSPVARCGHSGFSTSGFNVTSLLSATTEKIVQGQDAACQTQCPEYAESQVIFRKLSWAELAGGDIQPPGPWKRRVV
ncbi:hypothetical protein Y1Q_0024200 [Alligator mississippiensis]|uniref:Uncharacterized protein n=1 Tax=Alligator mississippiensis TaxID=8496 RepID=A0A151NI21_ALLMI|nr:hypothetical protein Y1Q_0024200 [Alligator mississippiensis]